MGDVISGRTSCNSNGLADSTLAGDFDELPQLSKLMCGVKTPDGRGWICPPHTLVVWLEGSLAKWCFRSDDKSPKLYGAISGLQHGLRGIESALANLQCEWKAPRSNLKS